MGARHIPQTLKFCILVRAIPSCEAASSSFFFCAVGCWLYRPIFLFRRCHFHYVGRYSPFHKEWPTCIRQPHASQAILCSSDWPWQVKTTLTFYCPSTHPNHSKGPAGGCRQLPSPAHSAPLRADAMSKRLLALSDEGKGEKVRALRSLAKKIRVKGTRTVDMAGGSARVCEGHGVVIAGRRNGLGFCILQKPGATGVDSLQRICFSSSGAVRDGKQALETCMRWSGSLLSCLHSSILCKCRDVLVITYSLIINPGCNFEDHAVQYLYSLAQHRCQQFAMAYADGADETRQSAVWRMRHLSSLIIMSFCE